MAPRDENAGLIAGRHAVAQALAQRPERAQELLWTGNPRTPALAGILDAARAAGVKLKRVERARLDSLCQKAGHQGVALRMAGGAGYAELEDLIAAAQAARDKALLVAAAHLEDPHNLGAVIRSAAAAGAQGVVIPKDRAAPLSPAAVKASAGAAEILPVARVTNLTGALERLKEAGLWLLAAESRGAPPPWELDLRMPLVLVVGSEHKGVPPRVLSACDMTASLPLAEGVESLNASVAAGVLLFEIVRQRMAAAK